MHIIYWFSIASVIWFCVLQWKKLKSACSIMPMWFQWGWMHYEKCVRFLRSSFKSIHFHSIHYFVKFIRLRLRISNTFYRNFLFLSIQTYIGLEWISHSILFLCFYSLFVFIIKYRSIRAFQHLCRAVQLHWVLPACCL